MKEIQKNNQEKSNEMTFLTASEATKLLALAKSEIQRLFDLQVIKNIRIGGSHLTTLEYLRVFKNQLFRDEELKEKIENDVCLLKIYKGE